MKTKPGFTQINGIGGNLPCDVIICDRCDGEDFVIYSVLGHTHLQCVGCDKTFCSGECSKPKLAKKDVARPTKNRETKQQTKD